MKPRYLLAAAGTLLLAGVASAQYVPASYQQPYCREFTKVVTVGGAQQPAYGKACYQPDGSWQIVSDDIPSSQPVQYVPEQNYVTYQPPLQPVYYQEPAYYRAPSSFSIRFSSWNPNRARYYNDYGHGWRDYDRGRHHARDRGRGPGRGDGHHGGRH